MRIAIAELKQETNSFVPFLTTLDTFRDQIAARILMADTPGPTCGNMRAIPFTKVTRPFWPMDFSNSAGRP